MHSNLLPQNTTKYYHFRYFINLFLCSSALPPLVHQDSELAGESDTLKETAAYISNMSLQLEYEFFTPHSNECSKIKRKERKN